MQHEASENGSTSNDQTSRTTRVVIDIPSWQMTILQYAAARYGKSQDDILTEALRAYARGVWGYMNTDDKNLMKWETD